MIRSHKTKAFTPETIERGAVQCVRLCQAEETFLWISQSWNQVVCLMIVIERARNWLNHFQKEAQKSEQEDCLPSWCLSTPVTKSNSLLTHWCRSGHCIVMLYYTRVTYMHTCSTRKEKTIIITIRNYLENLS